MKFRQGWVQFCLKMIHGGQKSGFGNPHARQNDESRPRGPFCDKIWPEIDGTSSKSESNATKAVDLCFKVEQSVFEYLLSLGRCIPITAGYYTCASHNGTIFRIAWNIAQHHEIARLRPRITFFQHRKPLPDPCLSEYTIHGPPYRPRGRSYLGKY